MANPLLDRAPPEVLSGRGQVIESTVKICDFGRLVKIATENLAAISGEKQPREWQAAPVNIRLRFAWADDRGRIPSLDGRIETTIAAVCQRCLEPFELPLCATLKILLVNDAGLVAEQDEFEIWEIEEGAIRPLDIVEEALIMALPISSMHPSGELCLPLVESTASVTSETVRPFADLRSRMNKSN